MNIGLGHALRGLVFLVRTQRNARVHGVITALVLAVGVWLQITRLDWCLIALAASLVWAAEALNTAVERLADRVTTERDPQIKQSKDVAAGAVLIASAGAVMVGLLVLGPPLFARLGG